MIIAVQLLGCSRLFPFNFRFPMSFTGSRGLFLVLQLWLISLSISWSITISTLSHFPYLLDWSRTNTAFIAISTTHIGWVVLALWGDVVGIFDCYSRRGCQGEGRLQFYGFYEFIFFENFYGDIFLLHW